jgi:hypothetical protein
MARRTSFALRVAAIPILAVLIVFLEARHPFAMFRLAVLAAAFFLLADIASLLRGKGRDFLIVPASLVFGMLVVEAVADIREPRQSAVVPPRGLNSLRPVVGWGPVKPGRYHVEKIDPKTGATIYGADYTIDSHLLRQTLSCEKGSAVVFLGCSYTFGDGLNDDETLPQLFADSVGRKERVLNLGFTGYGPQQFLSELQSGTYDSVIGPHPKLFVILTSVVHAERCACKVHWARRGPRYIIENGQLILKGTCYEGPSLWWEEWLQNSATSRWLVAPYRRALSHDDVELYIQITLAVVNLARAKFGAPAVVLYFNWDENYLRGTGFTNADVMQRMRDGGAAVVDASLGNEAAAGMALNIPGDGHPTALANRLRAALLKNYLEQDMPEVLASNRN